MGTCFQGLRVFVFQEGLRAGEQFLLLWGKKQGCQQNLRPDTGSFLCNSFWRALCLFIISLKFPPVY